MAFDLQKVGVGAVFYGVAVLLPTVTLLFDHFNWHSQILERIAIGVLGLLAVDLIYEGFRGERAVDPTAQPRYWGLQPIPIAVGLALLYVAWISNIPAHIGGKVDGNIFVVADNHVMRLGSVWGRVVEGVITMAGVFVLARWGFKTKLRPEERANRRAQRRADRASRRQAVRLGKELPQE